MDLHASNHMTSYGEWFKEMKNPEKSRYGEIGNDTTIAIARIGCVPF